MDLGRRREKSGGTVLIVDDEVDDGFSALRALEELFRQLCMRSVHSAKDLFNYLEGKLEIPLAIWNLVEKRERDGSQWDP